eukprot:TRINITY_DN982_c1_g1_i2.p1 TRINITY_DN982_c1_g1~~TRINITY_DN982_c1_g1_i2.p1  ORF type:complete len:1301 (+),score=418.23 TRINITY_DN982_c1_g1_i2:85-3903(+)
MAECPSPVSPLPGGEGPRAAQGAPARRKRRSDALVSPRASQCGSESSAASSLFGAGGAVQSVWFKAKEGDRASEGSSGTLAAPSPSDNAGRHHAAFSLLLAEVLQFIKGMQGVTLEQSAAQHLLRLAVAARNAQRAEKPGAQSPGGKAPPSPVLGDGSGAGSPVASPAARSLADDTPRRKRGSHRPSVLARRASARRGSAAPARAPKGPRDKFKEAVGREQAALRLAAVAEFRHDRVQDLVADLRMQLAAKETELAELRSSHTGEVDNFKANVEVLQKRIVQLSALLGEHGDITGGAREGRGKPRGRDAGAPGEVRGIARKNAELAVQLMKIKPKLNKAEEMVARQAEEIENLKVQVLVLGEEASTAAIEARVKRSRPQGELEDKVLALTTELVAAKERAAEAEARAKAVEESLRPKLEELRTANRALDKTEKALQAKLHALQAKYEAAAARLQDAEVKLSAVRTKTKSPGSHPASETLSPRPAPAAPPTPPEPVHIVDPALVEKNQRLEEELAAAMKELQQQRNVAGVPQAHLDRVMLEVGHFVSKAMQAFAATRATGFAEPPSAEDPGSAGQRLTCVMQNIATLVRMIAELRAEGGSASPALSAAAPFSYSPRVSILPAIFVPDEELEGLSETDRALVLLSGSAAAMHDQLAVAAQAEGVGGPLTEVLKRMHDWQQKCSELWEKRREQIAEEKRRERERLARTDDPSEPTGCILASESPPPPQLREAYERLGEREALRPDALCPHCGQPMPKEGSVKRPRRSRGQKRAAPPEPEQPPRGERVASQRAMQHTGSMTGPAENVLRTAEQLGQLGGGPAPAGADAAEGSAAHQPPPRPPPRLPSSQQHAPSHPQQYEQHRHRQQLAQQMEQQLRQRMQPDLHPEQSPQGLRPPSPTLSPQRQRGAPTLAGAEWVHSDSPLGALMLEEQSAPPPPSGNTGCVPEAVRPDTADAESPREGGAEGAAPRAAQRQQPKRAGPQQQDRPKKKSQRGEAAAPQPAQQQGAPSGGRGTQPQPQQRRRSGGDAPEGLQVGEPRARPSPFTTVKLGRTLTPRDRDGPQVSCVKSPRAVGGAPPGACVAAEAREAAAPEPARPLRAAPAPPRRLGCPPQQPPPRPLPTCPHGDLAPGRCPHCQASAVRAQAASLRRAVLEQLQGGAEPSAEARGAPAALLPPQPLPLQAAEQRRAAAGAAQRAEMAAQAAAVLAARPDGAALRPLVAQRDVDALLAVTLGEHPLASACPLGMGPGVARGSAGSLSLSCLPCPIVHAAARTLCE